MYDFPQLLKAIRQETHLTQAELAEKLESSVILVTMIESGQREPSKKFVEKLAEKMEVSPNAIIPFSYDINKYRNRESIIERKLESFGMYLQEELIKKKARNILKEHREEKRYLIIGLRSKNEIAKRLSSTNLPYEEAKNLIDDCLGNLDTYWHDHPERSEPEKQKWVRNSAGTPLGKLQKLVDHRILRPYDDMVPVFIHGGISGRNTKSAVMSLTGRHNKRIMLKLDMRRFFEHISRDDVMEFFTRKTGCSEKAANILARLCCVPEGPKGSGSSNIILGRGFATSPRLAVWCNLDIFLRISWLVQRRLKGHEPVIAIYVDDVCITASKASPKQMADLFFEIERLLDNSKGCKLEINPKKTRIINYLNQEYNLQGQYVGQASYEALGAKMGRNSVSISDKSRGKLSRLQQKSSLTEAEKRSLKGLKNYSRYLKNKER